MGDIRQALRALARMPLVTCVVVVSLGIGIGVNTVVFSWIQGVVRRPLPGVARATSYYLVEARSDSRMYAGVSWPEYLDLGERLTTFRWLLAFRMTPVYMGAPGQVERAYGLLVSGNYFQSLGLRPALGRFIAPEEVSRPGDAPVVVISYDLWQNRFGGQPSILGQPLRVNGRELTVVGVAPARFQGTILGLTFDVWIPATLAPDLLPGSRELTARDLRGYTVMGELQPGATRLQAQANLDSVMRRLAEDYPATNATMRGEVLGFTESPRGPQRFLPAALGLLQAAMLLLLLMVCGNTANLILARASVRQREIGIRLGLGASPAKIVRLLMTENLVLALGGALLGLAIASWGSDALRSIPPIRGLPIRFQTGIDVAGFLFTIGLGAGCGVLIGAAPALQLSRMDPGSALRLGNRNASRSRLRDALMATQAGLAVVVLIVAALFVRGLSETRTIDPGFDREGVLLAAYDLTGRAVTPESARLFADRLVQSARGITGVTAAAVASSVPLDIHGLPSRSFTVEGHARPGPDEDRAASTVVTPQYFEVMGIPLVAGRGFAELSDPGAPRQVVVNEEFVRRYLPGLEPIGRRVESGGRTFTIVGVARNSLYNAFGEPPTAALYLSYRDLPSGGGEIHVRTRPGSENALVPALRRAIAAIDPDLPLYNVRTLAEHVEMNLVFRRVPARLFAVLGPLVLLLASFGIYAVVSYSVSTRTAEIGVRIALGATARRIVRSILADSMKVVVAGAMLGWVAIFVVVVDVVSGRADLTAFSVVPLVLLAVASAACWVPARRAAAVDPVIALRRE